MSYTSKSESSQSGLDEFFDKLKENYVLRIEECGNFSKRFSTACLDLNAEFLYGTLNLIQQNIDLQKKYKGFYPQWLNHNVAIQQSKLITEAWIQSIQYLDSFYIEFLKYAKINLRTVNKSLGQFIQEVDKYATIYGKTESDRQDKPDLEDKVSPKQIVSKKEPSQS